MNINKVFLAGRITKAPELKVLPSGTKVCSFSLVTNEYKKDSDEEKAEFHNIISFGNTAENTAKYVVKGQVLFVEGKIQTRSWDKDGVKQYRTEIVARIVQFGAKPSGAAAKQDDAAESTAPTGGVQYDDDIDPNDIPF